MTRGARTQRGVALVLVMWVSVLLTVIAASFIVERRTEAMIIHNSASIARAEAAQYLSVYYTKPGGLWKARRLLTVAGAHRMLCDINGSGEMGIGNAANLQLAASSPEIVLPGTIPRACAAATAVDASVVPWRDALAYWPCWLTLPLITGSLP